MKIINWIKLRLKIKRLRNRRALPKQKLWNGEECEEISYKQIEETKGGGE
jgi:hypothetical protein